MKNEIKYILDVDGIIFEASISIPEKIDLDYFKFLKENIELKVKESFLFDIIEHLLEKLQKGEKTTKKGVEILFRCSVYDKIFEHKYNGIDQKTGKRLASNTFHNIHQENFTFGRWKYEEIYKFIEEKNKNINIKYVCGECGKEYKKEELDIFLCKKCNERINFI